ncbi:MAG: amidohydrolase family protein [Spirochaetes bacterium]|nr:amidohydrolase family protein [Spirochaetota bacterium]
MKKWTLKCSCAISSDSTVQNATIEIDGAYISAISKSAVSKPDADISNSVATPGLINSHDHLIGNYFPKVGNGPYINWLPWDNDLKSAPAYRERQQIANRDLYLLAGYRNLISGVTSVHDHIPHFVQDPFLDIMPLKVISDYTLVHSITQFALNWGEGIEAEYARSEKEGIPFVAHVGEGFDEESRNELKILNQKGGLGEYSVLVHSISFTPEEIALVKQKKASVVWCADSNIFMYNRTADIKTMLKTGVNVCIGTDSPMSGGENILHEMKFGRKFYNDHYNEDLPAKQIFKMTTENPARAFRLAENGKLAEGMLADIVLFDKKNDDPYESVVNADLKDVKLAIINGIPVYGHAVFLDSFKNFGIKYQTVRIAGIDRFIIGDLLGVLNRINKAVGFKKKFPFMPVEL